MSKPNIEVTPYGQGIDPHRQRPSNHVFEVVPALCLDMDGTVRITKSNKPFAEHREDYQLMPGIEEKIWEYRHKGFVVLGITNQDGVAHGHKTQADVIYESEYTMRLFKNNPFAWIFAAHNDEKGHVPPHNHRSLLRKPSIGLLAIAETYAFNEGWIIDWNNSLMVSDRPEDEQLAANASIHFYHIDGFLKAPVYAKEPDRK